MQTVRMQSDPLRLRQILAANFRRLMDSNSKLGTIKKVADASGGDLSNGKLGRIHKANATTDVDSLEPLARLFGLEPWQLLVEDLDPENLPALTTTPLLEQIRSLVATGQVETPVRENTLEESARIVQASAIRMSPKGGTRKRA